MQLIIEKNYDLLSRKAANDMARFLEGKHQPLVCTASGDSPAGLYAQLSKLQQDGKLNTANWFFAGLDEWVGKNGDDEGSCRYYLDRQLYQPLNVEEERICFFNGQATDLQNECERMETFIEHHGPMNIAVVGLGMNGHIGFNEPGVSPLLTTHISNLDSSTIQTGQKYFKEKQQLSQGITIGLATLMDAEHIFLIVSGEHKAAIVQKALEGPVTENIPATLLRSHPQLHIYLDEAAAQLLSPSLK
jgi:galactosamine-6-phosphate isomerase